MRLLNRTPLIVYSVGETDGFLEDGEWVTETREKTRTIRCSLQPAPEGKTKIRLPEGIRTTDAKLVYTRSELIASDEKDNTFADEIELRGKRFQCYKEYDWTGFGLKSDHYKYLFIRKDKL